MLRVLALRCRLHTAASGKAYKEAQCCLKNPST